jgi:alpha-aminoadipic semialdehyde synthase
VTKNSIKKIFESQNNPQLKVIGDITCDINGSIEFNLKTTSPDNPVYLYDPMEDKITDGVSGKGIIVMAIDNLPAEIPRESSIFFSKTLKSFVPGIAEADFSQGFEGCFLPPEIKKAVILYKGEFTREYKFMEEFL